MIKLSKQNLVTILATVGYVGKGPVAPGTLGSLVALAFWYVFTLLSPIGYVVATLAFCIFSIVVCTAYENAMQTHDASEIVIDEVAGMLVALALMPVNWKVAVLGFLLFRLFDVLKPFPIGALDKKVKGGFGVVVDDLVAGLITNICLQLAWRFQPNLVLV